MKRLALILGILLMTSASFAGEKYIGIFLDCPTTSETAISSIDIMLSTASTSVLMDAYKKGDKLEETLSVENGALLILTKYDGEAAISGFTFSVSSTGITMETTIESEGSSENVLLESSGKIGGGEPMKFSMTTKITSKNEPQSEPKKVIADYTCK